MNNIRHVALIAMVFSAALAGCSGNLDDTETLGLGAFVTAAGLGQACNMPLPELKALSKKKFTIGELGEPAYVVGYRFICESSTQGRVPWTIYVGWALTNNGKNLGCVHWSKNESEVIDSRAWIGCGGLKK